MFPHWLTDWCCMVVSNNQTLIYPPGGLACSQFTQDHIHEQKWAGRSLLRNWRNERGTHKKHGRKLFSNEGSEYNTCAQAYRWARHLLWLILSSSCVHSLWWAVTKNTRGMHLSFVLVTLELWVSEILFRSDYIQYYTYNILWSRSQSSYSDKLHTYSIIHIYIWSYL